MRALVLQDWWKITVEEVPDPQICAADVLIDVLAVGICGSDIHGYTGENGRRRPGQIMGHELVGRVRDVGANVNVETGIERGVVVTVNPVLNCEKCEQCQKGAQQACVDKTVLGVTPDLTSAFAQLLVAPAKNVIPLPKQMPIEYGALVEPLAVGYHALRRGGCGPGERVLILGGGPIGQACVLAASRLGAARIAVSEMDAHRRKLNASLGAVSLDLTTADDVPGAVERALEGKPSLVVDAVGTSKSLATALACAPLSGKIVLVGMGAPNLDVPAYEISTSERTMIGSFCYSADEFRDTARWVGTVPAELALLVEARVELDEAPHSFHALASGELRASKVLVYPNGLDAAQPAD